MGKTSTYYVCSNCGYTSLKWLGKCPSCGMWDTFKEYKEGAQEKQGKVRMSYTSLKEIKTTDFKKVPTGIYEFDRVLDGGIVPSSFILIGGDPGIGKSTLLLEVSRRFSEKGYKVLYVSGEESLEQVKLRCERLGINSENIYLMNEQDLTRILEAVEEIKPSFAIVDSIQTIFKPEMDQVIGSVSQVRECGAELLRLAKEGGTTVIVVGHVTKDGTLAGPKTLEHMVDVVLYLEGEKNLNLRILRATKNRFGTTEEIGIFEMTGEGLKEVADASTLFITRDHVRKEGISYTVLLEGKRPLILEIQSLVLPTFFAVPQRVTTGFDTRRLYMLLAVMERFAGVNLRNMDIFLNVTGGIKIMDSSADLAVVASIISSYKKIPLGDNTIFLGEVGLGGEIRMVPGLHKRIEEARRLGFTSIFSPLEYKTLEEVVKLCFG
ncbi:MAG: DNA repair protein RadA [Candidatus Hydrothermia bacterium]